MNTMFQVIAIEKQKQQKQTGLVAVISKRSATPEQTSIYIYCYLHKIATPVLYWYDTLEQAVLNVSQSISALQNNIFI